MELLNSKNIRCPNCNAELQKAPTKKCKCIHCNKYIFVKTNPRDKIKVLVTEDEADKIDKEWIEIRENKKIDKWKDLIFNEFGGKIKDYENIIKTSGSPNARDHIWAMLNHLIMENTKAKNIDYNRISSIYYRMAVFLSEENKESFDSLYDSTKFQLLNYKNDKSYKDLGIDIELEISAAGEKACRYCKKLAGKKYSIDKALLEMPIPHKNCETIVYGDKPFCRCQWRIVLKDF